MWGRNFGGFSDLRQDMKETPVDQWDDGLPRIVLYLWPELYLYYLSQQEELPISKQIKRTFGCGNIGKYFVRWRIWVVQSQATPRNNDKKQEKLFACQFIQFLMQQSRLIIFSAPAPQSYNTVDQQWRHFIKYCCWNPISPIFLP